MRKLNLKPLGINAGLMGLLFLSITANKEFLRPALAGQPFFDMLTGCLPNFLAAFIISLFPAAPLWAKRVPEAQARLVIFVVAGMVFLTLSLEEFTSWFGASAVLDVCDIVASGLGAGGAVITILWIRRHLSRRQAEGSAP
jgi:hypothetical protein